MHFKISSIFLKLFFCLPLVGQINFQKPFEDCQIQGSTTIYDYNAKKWITNDIKDSHKQTLPASTFKIVNTLIALETGVIKSENDTIFWPGFTDTIKYGYRPEIYNNMTVKDAFKASAGWVYVLLAEQIGKENYHKYLSSTHYGNVDLSNQDTDFWNFGNFGISPANQIDILIGVHEESLPFKKESFKILKSLMIEEESENEVFRAKTGWTRADSKDTGWWVGYLENKENVYFFATRLIKERKTQNPKFASCRKEITKEILKLVVIE